MTKSEFIYVTYIRTSQEKAWNALRDGDLTRRYWEAENISDWKPGSQWRHERPGSPRQTLIVGEVVEVDAPRRLVMTWADPADVNDKSRHSRVTFELEPVDEMVRLTVRHDGLEAGSPMDEGIRGGWPRVLSSMKSLLETGEPLRTWLRN